MITSNELEGLGQWHRSGLRQRKADLKELAKRGENWALVELEQLRRAERTKNKAAYERFKANHTPESLRFKWRQAKAAQRLAARSEAEERNRKAEELAAKAAAEAERERKAQAARAGSGTEVEIEVLRVPANPYLLVCRYWFQGSERRCTVRVQKSVNFLPRMKFWLVEPSDPAARCRPWPYGGPLPRRKGRW
ncbi:MAG: hypothetical protein WB586_13545 [Chthoniobacterales bacterium]